MKRLVIATFVVFTSFPSCVNYFAARDIMHNHPKHYNGIDTLIRIDGYYYFFRNNRIAGATIFDTDGTIKKAPLTFTDHTSIRKHFLLHYSSLSRGIFTIYKDSVKVKWASRYDVLSYDLYEETFLIQNDTTLLRVYRYTTASEQRVNTDTIVYRFHPFELNMKK